ncbi:hypothetical protein LUX57_30230 [Actinomadura madurae]|uniref:hypothetical protein n=1 Tax=Actinomadura madurae TaxID=1993 RepID=UPI0020D20BDA|nr:hypothetical protein [Actinomadura madurae]MCP9968927.1 hypothetical protein [Actinomadura madurae]
MSGRPRPCAPGGAECAAYPGDVTVAGDVARVVDGSELVAYVASPAAGLTGQGVTLDGGLILI